MRALPLIERVMIVAVAVVIVALLGFLLAWHLRWHALQRSIAAIVPRPGVVMPVPTRTDPTLFADFIAWGQRARAVGRFHQAGFYSQIDAVAAWLNSNTATAPAAAGEARMANAGLLRDLDALLARGLHLGTFPPDFRYREDYSSAYVAFHDAGGAWACCARLDGDPTAAVMAQERLYAASSPADSESALAWLGILADDRDRTCLMAALHGQLPARLREHWHATPDEMPQVLPALEYERCRLEPGLYSAWFGMNPLAFWRDQHPLVPWGRWRYLLVQWWQLPERCAEQIAAVEKTETAFIHGQADTLSGVLAASVRHRFMLLADDVLAQRDGSGALPGDPHLGLAGGPLRLPLRYQVLGADRFAIMLDQAAALAPAMARFATDDPPDLSLQASRPAVDLTSAVIIVDCTGSMVGTGR
jgi:hypothetical protein